MANSGGNDGLERVKAFKLLHLEQPAGGKGARKRVKATFRLIPKESNYLDGLTSVITQNGGDLVYPEETESVNGDYAIKLLNLEYYVHHPQENCLLPFDTFSGLFVRDAVKAFEHNGPPPNLNAYRLTASKYQDFDANFILDQKVKWTDLEQVVNRARPRVTAQQVLRKFKEIMERKKKQGAELEKQCVADGNGGTQELEPANCESPQVIVASPEIVDVGPLLVVPERDKHAETDPKKTGKNIERNMAQVSKSLKALLLGDEQKGAAAYGEEISDKKRNAQAHRCRRILSYSSSDSEDEGGQSDNSGPNLIPETPASAAAEISGHAGDDQGGAGAKDMDESSLEESVQEEEDEDDDDFKEPGAHFATKAARPNEPFTQAEGQRILTLICRANAYKFINEVGLWKQLEETKQFPRRTYETLKEHFRKDVLPNVLEDNKLYSIKAANLAMLKSGIEEALANSFKKLFKRSKSVEICPSFKFS